MKCEAAQQDIALVAFGELPDDSRDALDQHLSTCARCQGELEAVRALQQAMSLTPSDEVSPNLLAKARVRLEEALDGMPRSGWMLRAWQKVMAGVSVLGRAPATAFALLVVGFGAGGLAGYRTAPKIHPAGQTAQGEPSHSATAASESAAAIHGSLQGSLPIASVDSINRDPNSENVEVRFNRLVPETVRGSLDDPLIRQLLLVGAQNRLDPGVQQNSVGLLAEECRAGHQCSDGPVLKALLVALRYDRNAGVRLKALNGLEPYVAQDMHVRDSVLEALMRDSDPAIRSRAIELLQPVQADSSVQEVLHTVASEDDNPHIRTVSREVLDQTPQFQ